MYLNIIISSCPKHSRIIGYIDNCNQMTITNANNIIRHTSRDTKQRKKDSLIRRINLV